MKEKTVSRITNDYQPTELAEVLVLLDKLSEADREKLLKYLVCQPIDRRVVGEILKIVADRLTNSSFGSPVHEANSTAKFKKNETERKLAFN
jgi:hypothetical protein